MLVLQTILHPTQIQLLGIGSEQLRRVAVNAEWQMDVEAPPYLRDDTALPWFSEFGIQQSRGFRALKLWLLLSCAGMDAYRAAIARDIALAQALRRHVRQSPDLEIVAAGPLSITCFGYRPPDQGNAALAGLKAGA